MAAADTIVSLENIFLKYGGVPILTEICWRIERGCHWALLGANGSGKTSLLKLVTGYEWPDEGTVTVLGERFGNCDLRALRKAIGYVSSALEHQLPGRDTALEVAVSGFEASIGLYRDMNRQELDRAGQALTRVGIAHLAERTYRTLSQGEQQRVLIARALVSEPALLILDEPCAGLDPQAREAFLDDLGRMSSRPDCPTMVLVTHHIEEIGPWISNVLVLKEGRMVAAGPRHEVLTGATLSAAFGGAWRVESIGDRYYLRPMK